MNEFSFFSHHRINDHTYLIRESFGYHKDLPNSYFFIGVVIGRDKVAVIDSGNGATGGLRRYIEEKILGGNNDKPIINLLTHNHLDHIGGCMMFDERYLHTDDIVESEIAWATNLDRHFMSDLSDMAAFCQNNQEVLSYVRENYYRPRATAADFIPINDGDEIDLGGLTVQVLLMPTHTKGSCAFYVKEDHIAFSGDAITPNGSTVSREYINGESRTVYSYKRAKELWAEDSLICGGHHMPWGMDLLDKLIESSYEILEGINLRNDAIAPPSFFVYQDETHAHRIPPGVIGMRHYYKDINQGYRVKIP